MPGVPHYGLSAWEHAHSNSNWLLFPVFSLHKDGAHLIFSCARLSKNGKYKHFYFNQTNSYHPHTQKHHATPQTAPRKFLIYEAVWYLVKLAAAAACCRDV